MGSDLYSLQNRYKGTNVTDVTDVTNVTECLYVIDIFTNISLIIFISY